MSNRIDVYVHDTSGGSTPSVQENLTASKVISLNQNNVAAKNQMATKGMVVASTIASGAFNYVTSNVGTLTGNQQAQQQVNNVVQVGQTAAMFFASPVMASVNVGMQLATTAIDEGIRRRKESVVLAQTRARAGYTTDNVANYRRR